MKLILRPEVFYDGYRPKRVWGREEEIRKLRESIEAFERGEEVKPISLIGEYGMGKTTVLREARTKVNISSIFVECWKYRNPSEVLSKIFLAISPACHLGGLSIEKRVKMLERAIKCKETKVVLFLDDAHLLPVSFLEELRRVKGIFLVISYPPGNEGLLFSSSYIYLGKLPSEAIYMILKERAGEGLILGSWNEELLQLISELSEGNPRKAIEILLLSALQAEKEGREEITPEDVRSTAYSLGSPLSLEKALFFPPEEKEILRAAFSVLLNSPFCTISDIVEVLRMEGVDLSAETVRKRIFKLVKEGLLCCKKIGRTNMYFVDFPLRHFKALEERALAEH